MENKPELPPNIEDRVRALTAENDELKQQLEAARREIAELRATGAVEVDLDDDPAEPGNAEVGLLEVAGGGSGAGPSGFEDVDTDEHLLPRQLPGDGGAAALESVFSDPEANDPFDEATTTASKSSPRLQPLEPVQLLPEPPQVSPDLSDTIERKRTLAFVGAVVGVVLLAAAVVGVVVYRTAENSVASALAAPTPAVPAPAEPVAERSRPVAEPADPGDAVVDDPTGDTAEPANAEPEPVATREPPARPKGPKKKRPKRRRGKKRKPIVVTPGASPD